MSDIAQVPRNEMELRHHFQEMGSDPNWVADLRLRFGTRADFPGTVLLERRHVGPLVVQRPFHPEGDPCHVYIVHPPGGVVGGDELSIHVTVDPRAHALITTPAATKFYRCDGRRSSQTQELRVTDATLEFLPQENIFYRGADVRTATRIHVDATSRFIGWEIACLGLPARNEPFDAGRLALDLELWRDDPVFIDRLRLAGESTARRAAWGLAGHEAVGTLLATPATPADLDAVRELVANHPFAAVSVVDRVLVLRALAAQAAPIRELFVAAWRVLRPAILGRPAHPPRIWST
ncbi:MAG TPA: urease accessory protein UreD [Steroidobacteraceae bacterium]|nr:urease accessory protein UreD [Steroidobacteraceae bacterium]